MPTVPVNRIQFLQWGKCDMLLTPLNYTAERATRMDLIERGFVRLKQTAEATA